MTTDVRSDKSETLVLVAKPLYDKDGNRIIYTDGNWFTLKVKRDVSKN